MRRCIDAHGLAAEIIVADNGSTDGSREIARRSGARVVEVADKGYGSALMGGFDAARGRFLVMGDADGSYDFGEAMALVEKLREGHDLVMGSRFRGRILPGAMPWKHRWIGNPVLSAVGRVLFRAPVSDFHCGLRALTRDAYRRMALRTSGMEFASEIVVKAVVNDMRVAEVPITLHPDGRSRPPHLRSWRDGWRHLSFLLTLSPRFTLFLPGLVLAGVGVLLMSVLVFGPATLGEVRFGVHTLLAASLLVLVGYQAMTTALAARLFVMVEELGPPSPGLLRAFEGFSLGRGLLASLALFALGAGCIGWILRTWAAAGFGDLEPEDTMRPMVVGATLIALGAQTLFMSFVYTMLGIQRRRRD